MSEAAKLISDLMQCDDCKGKAKDGFFPFFFPIKKQKIMLVTAIPSYQTLLKPLYSVRFYRRLCNALLGEENINDRCFELFNEGGIYWTHYHKCYYSAAFKNKFNLSNSCYKKYFYRELEILRPNLELIIFMGELVYKKICRSRSQTEFEGIKCSCVDFPDGHNYHQYGEIKNNISRILNLKPSDEPQTVKYNKISETLNAVHLDFELVYLLF